MFWKIDSFILCFTTVNPALPVGCLFILITLNKKWQRLICSINTGRASEVCSVKESWEQCCFYQVLVNFMNNSLASNIPQCTGWVGRSVLWGEEHQIKRKVAFVNCLSKPGDSLSDSQRKLKVPSCLPVWEKGDWDRTSLLCFLWEPFSTPW